MRLRGFELFFYLIDRICIALIDQNALTKLWDEFLIVSNIDEVVEQWTSDAEFSSSYFFALSIQQQLEILLIFKDLEMNLQR